jgi:hypothetical protein
MTESEMWKDICKNDHGWILVRDLVRNILENIFQIHHISPPFPSYFTLR